MAQRLKRSLHATCTVSYLDAEKKMHGEHCGFSLNQPTAQDAPIPSHPIPSHRPKSTQHHKDIQTSVSRDGCCAVGYTQPLLHFSVAFRPYAMMESRSQSTGEYMEHCSYSPSASRGTVRFSCSSSVRLGPTARIQSVLQ